MESLNASVGHLLSLIHTIIPSWGWAIVAFSFALRLALLPFQITAFRESGKLARLQPALQALLDLHREAPQAYLRDSRKLKRKAGVRSWIPIASGMLQLPIFMIVYRAIPRLTALQGTPFLWLQSLTAADPL